MSSNEAGSSTGGASNVEESGGTSAASSSNQNQPPPPPPAAASEGPTTKIRKARQRLRSGDGVRQFTPVEVSIGAYHREIRHSNGVKRDVADTMCPHPGATWGLVQNKLKDQHQLSTSNDNDNGSEWYPDDAAAMRDGYFSFSATASDGTSRMPLMDDVCYVLHFLLDYGDEEVSDEDEGVGNENSVMRDILFLLENQIPWSVLREMHRCIRSDDGSSDPVLDEELAGRVWELLEDRLYTRWQRPVPSPAPTHLLHLVHHYFKPTERRQGAAPTGEYRVNIVGPSQPEREQRRMGRWRRATEYRRYAFLQLKRREFKEGEVQSVLDVRLDGGTLWIPTLRIDDLTCTILRNLIALEDRMRMRQRPVTAYCLFMSQLACKVEDVELLQRLGILQNFLPTDEDVVRGFGDLCKGVVFEVDEPKMNYLNDTWHELHKRCQTEPINFIGLFFEKYFSNSVHTLAFVAAFLLFVFQAAQVVFAILSYLHQIK